MLFNGTLTGILKHTAIRRPGHTAILADERQITYAELWAEVGRTAALLQQLGVAQRERVGICLPKIPEEIVATLGVAAVRAVFVNVNYQWTVDQLAHVARDAGLVALITDERRARQIVAAGIDKSLKRLIVVGESSAAIACTTWVDRPSKPIEPVASIGTDLAALLYTSGSTGRPKGVMLTQGMLVRGAEIVGSYLNSHEDDRVLSVPPFSFDYGLNQLITMILVGGTLVLQRTPLPAEIARTATAARITGLPLVAPSWVQLVRYLQDAPAAFPDLRYVTNTGGAIPKPVLEAMPGLFAGAEIYLMYGLTEAFRSTYLPPEMFVTKMGAIGRAIPNVEILVVHPETGLCGPNEIGELIHRGDLVSLGYWQQPEATSARIRSNEHLRPLIGDEVVVHSGDWVRQDEDGVLWYVGRMDSMIKCSGYRISPTEIEEIACRIRGIDHAVAFGVADDELGQTVHLAVQWLESEADDAALLTFFRQNAPSYMWPRAVYIHKSAMPRTSSGKIDRQAVITSCRDPGFKPVRGMEGEL